MKQHLKSWNQMATISLSSILEIPTPATHLVRLVAVPNEKLEGRQPTEIKFINELKVLDYFEAVKSKTEPFPISLVLLATGVIVTAEQIWNKYRKSNRIYFFIVEPVDNE